MIIINTDENIFDIIKKIQFYIKINKNIDQLASKIEKKFFKKRKNKKINLYIPENHDVLSTLSLLQIIAKEFSTYKIIIHSKGNIPKSFIKKSKITFISFKDTPLQKFQKTKWYKNKILFGGILVSLFALFYIFFLGAKNLFLYLTIDTQKLYSGQIQLQLSPFPESEKEIKLQTLITYTELTQDFLVTQLNFNSAKRASGIVEIVNTTNKTIYIPAKTVLTTEHNISYETVDSMKIAPDTGVNTFIIAQTHTKGGMFIGERGNIKSNTRLTFPDRKESSETLYAVSTGDFSGGNNDITSTLSKENLTNFEKIYNEKIREKAYYELAEITKFKAQEGDKDYIFVDNGESIVYEPIHITHILLDEANPSNIKIVGNIKAKGYFYDNEDVIKVIKEKLDYKHISELKTRILESSLENISPLRVKQRIRFHYKMKRYPTPS